MDITVSQKVEDWFRNELELSDGDGLRFFGKYGGTTNVHSGFSIGMEIAQPSDKPLVLKVQNGLKYFVEETDDWFFSDYDLSIDYDDKKDEPTYFFIESK